MSSGQINLLVFREERKGVSGDDLKSALVGDAACCVRSDGLLRPLLRAGELESGVADATPELLPTWQRLTDQIADALLSNDYSRMAVCSTLACHAAVPSCVHVSKPEGFAYYGLHALAYAEVLDRLGPLPSAVAVIGIRSIGTTLSAVTAAAARRRGLNASRTTVRPEGHPYNRRTGFSPQQLAWVKERSSLGARFLVVDEGPGLSGSTFLSVAEALVAAGVPGEEIVLICGHEPDLRSLCTDGALQRANRFRWVAVASKPPVPEGADIFIGGGEWRQLSFAHEPDWPPSWTSFERLKYLSRRDPNQRLFKFTGFGHYGDAVIEREREIAEADFGPMPAHGSHGFAVYPWLRGRPMRPCDLSEGVLSRLASYCAFRARAFPAACPDLGPLQEMAEHNLDQLGFDLTITLRLERPAIPDGRMQPHEWLLTADGQMLKTDSGSHGDDHFFPGPTDIAWDLAGVIVEWRMDSAETGFFLESYRHASGGDDASSRIADFITAYAAFRFGYCRMAANALLGTGEEARLRRAANGYLALISARLGKSRAHRAPARITRRLKGFCIF